MNSVEEILFNRKIELLEQENKELKEKLNKGLVIFEQNKKLFSDIEELKQVIKILKEKLEIELSGQWQNGGCGMYYKVDPRYMADWTKPKHTYGVGLDKEQAKVVRKVLGYALD